MCHGKLKCLVHVRACVCHFERSVSGSEAAGDFVGQAGENVLCRLLMSSGIQYCTQMAPHLLTTACLLLARIGITHQTHMSSLYTFFFPPRGPQIFPCLTYLERNVRVDCEFPATNEIPGPYCEYRQDSRLVGSTYPNAVIYVSTEDRRRSNVSLFAPNLCRLTWAPMADEKPYTYTCRVYQGTTWKENSMAVHHRILPICSAISVMFESAPWLLSVVISLPVALGLLNL